MANSSQGDGRSINWGHFLSPSLPPKSPSGVADAAGFFSGRSSTSSSNGSSSAKIHHHRTPSAGFVPQITTPQSWIDDMLDSPEAPARKIHHRRSASDTAAFLDIPDHHHHHHSTTSRIPGEEFVKEGEIEVVEDFSYRTLERLDDAEHIVTMFGGGHVDPSSRQRSRPENHGSNGNGNGSHCQGTSFETKQAHHPEPTSSPSDSANSGNDMSMDEGRAGPLSVPKAEPDEAQSSGMDHDAGAGRSSKGFNAAVASTGISKQPTASTHIDPNMDPKRAKRILANRQSAQRSRVRKLQYIAELERSVTALQTEVSALTPQVAFLDHQRILLNVDNNSIKQRITSLMQDKCFKDAQNEALTRELHRLRQMVLQQQEELRSQLQQFNAGDSDDHHHHYHHQESKASTSTHGLRVKVHAQAPDLTTTSSSPSSATNCLLREVENGSS